MRNDYFTVKTAGFTHRILVILNDDGSRNTLDESNGVWGANNLPNHQYNAIMGAILSYLQSGTMIIPDGVDELYHEL